MRYFPFFFKLKTQKILVVGGGDIALAKVRLLLKAQAQIKLVAPDIHADLLELLQQHQQCQHQLKAYHKSDMLDCQLIISATDDQTLNQTVARDAKSLGKPINVVDQSALCDFIFPAFIERGDLTIAVSSSGVAPVVTNWFRTWLEREVSPHWAQLLHRLDAFRGQIVQQLPDVRHRRSYYHRLLANHQNDLLQDNTAAMDQIIEQSLHNDDESKTKGRVYLIGAGPGSPELLTLKAHRLLQQADVVLYDRLIGADLLDLCRRDAHRVYVGKSRSHHHKKQAEINNLLLEYARNDQIVVRLKGGDPFVFGRGGEEMLFLQHHNIPVEVVPGVSAANGCAASYGIPLTLRQTADKLVFLTLYQDSLESVDWHSLVQPKQTLVLYMSLSTLPKIAEKMVKHGAPPTLPLAIIEKGTTSQQRILRSTLADIQNKSSIPLVSPAITIVGEVAAETLSTTYEMDYRVLEPMVV